MRQCEEVCISAPARSGPCPWAAARMVRPYQCRRSSLQLRESDSDARERSAHVHECSGTTRQAASVGPMGATPRAWAERRFAAIGQARLGATREPRNNTTQLICVYLLSKPHGIFQQQKNNSNAAAAPKAPSEHCAPSLSPLQLPPPPQPPTTVTKQFKVIPLAV